MTPNDMIKEFASVLRDVIRESDENYLKSDPEDAFVDLAARLVFRLKTITIVPVVPPNIARREEIARSRGAAAVRIFDIFTAWLNQCPECSYTTEKGMSGKYELVVRTPGKTQAFFQGVTVQDVYAQAAQAVSFNGGSLDEENFQPGND